ncbi:hypothetical protein [Frigoriglobus tundricola]|uniref:Uncharacterized protein n=1 Tax=Frigoriglobus tundricola TaxID=2774151 RepID=A0A6M5YLR3_9BACT|nr:hypothetical protein [Frigoriglobus tundricola]QJW94256.1 hypothetical protein FTUN_1776 [Frigoriglobus tundricola]
MLTTIALALLAGTPAQPADLKLSNVRMTIGELGPPREGNKLLPGDVLFVAYDIDGITIDGEGNAVYTMAMEVSDGAGKLIFKQDPRELTEFVPLRGNKMPARAFITIGLDQPPGVYNCKISVSDPKTKAVGTLNVKFEVLKKEFGVVAVFTTHDSKGELSAPNSGQVGQMLFVQFSIASFDRDKNKQPNVKVEFQVFDDKGLPTLTAPRKHVQTGAAPPVKDDEGAFALQFPLFLNRPGKFVVEIFATDEVSKKTSRYRLPVTVVAAN